MRVRRLPPLPILVGPRPRLLEFDVGPRRRTLNPIEVDSEDVREWIERRNPRPIGHWREIGAEEYARSFTAAQTAGLDVVDDLYFAFHDTIERGGTEVDFEREVMPILKAKGWLVDRGSAEVARRVRLIYDTNLRLARASGRWTRYQASKAALPYLRAVTARDDRVRHPPGSKSDHTAWDDIVLPIDHPFWTRWFPPLGFRCRCSVIQMSRSQLARSGRKVTTEVDLAAREARLGVPIFQTPAAGIAAQLAEMADVGDAPHIPGRPSPVDPAVALQIGARMHEVATISSIMASDAAPDGATMIERLFGLLSGK